MTGDRDGVTSGVDRFVFTSGDTGTTVVTADTITDFKAGTDKLDLSGTSVTIANGAGSDFTALSSAATTAFAGGSDVYIAFNADGSGNAYVFDDASGNNSFGAGDTLVVLTGIDTDAEILNGDIM